MKKYRMNKPFLTLMLVFASTSAMAQRTSGRHEWTSMGASSDQEVTYYLDFQSFQKKGQKVTVSEMMDFETPQQLNGDASKYFSSTLRIEFDCDARQSRILSFVMYAGPMGTKEIVYSAKFPSAPWEPVPPNSMTKEMWNSACIKM